MNHREWRKDMRRQMNHHLLLALSVALGFTSTAMGQGGGYTTIEFPGASSTLAWGINKGGDIVGAYTIAGVTHGFKLTGGQFNYWFLQIN